MPIAAQEKSIILGASPASTLIACDPTKTVGSLSSGADYAGVAYANLYSALWGCITAYGCVVTGGRGVSAVADFAANKPISMPSVYDSSDGQWYLSTNDIYTDVLDLQAAVAALQVAKSITMSPSMTIQTVAAAANGTQLSATRDAFVGYNLTTNTTATIGGASTAAVLLEVCPTNSAVAANWVEIDRVSNSQTLSLALALQSVQTIIGSVGGMIPAGYYHRLREVKTGTSSTTYNGKGQQILL